MTGEHFPVLSLPLRFPQGFRFETIRWWENTISPLRIVSGKKVITNSPISDRPRDVKITPGRQGCEIRNPPQFLEPTDHYKYPCEHGLVPPDPLPFPFEFLTFLVYTLFGGQKFSISPTNSLRKKAKCNASTSGPNTTNVAPVTFPRWKIMALTKVWGHMAQNWMC